MAEPIMVTACVKEVSVGTSRSDDAMATRKKRFRRKNNNFARASHFLVHFFAVFA